ncbi:hypothetical protein [Microvirga puerhi]|uniref:Transcription factor n=1 Tax=Microvirga puerhi TaxID=2876078 RepID=A0ABS7VVA6_9HYPH|nr:hypothetical protein [Microvirga puerhi]MBZ6078852.1 hypothetical protein [Microvirga puerhi]
MGYVIKDEPLLGKINALAKRRNRTVIDLLRDLIKAEEDRDASTRRFLERVKPVQAKVKTTGTPSPVDWSEIKRHDDELSGGL